MSGKLPVLTDAQRDGLRPELRDVIEYRKSGLSLNHVIGCPLDCAYCVRHLFGNYEMKAPRALLSDRDAVSMLVNHRYFEPHVTPVQVLNRATDPMLPAVKPHIRRPSTLRRTRIRQSCLGHHPVAGGAGGL